MLIVRTELERVSIGGEKCDVTLPWQQNFWITTMGDLSNDNGDGNENGKKAIDRFHSRGQHQCKFIGTNESVYIRKEFNSHRTGLEHQYGRRFIVLEHQYGRRDVM